MTNAQDIKPHDHVDSYARRMRRLKFGLPIIALLLIGLLVLWPYLTPEDILPQNLSAEKTDLSSNGLTMSEPRFSGTTKNQEPFSITAKTAAQNENDPAQVDLINLEASVTLAQLGQLNLTATGGDYHTVNRRLNLIGPIALTAPNGVSMELGDLRADLDAGTGQSEQPVYINAGAAKLKSGGLRVLEAGNRIIFDRHVHINFDPTKPFPVFEQTTQTQNLSADDNQNGASNAVPADDPMMETTE